MSFDLSDGTTSDSEAVEHRVLAMGLEKWSPARVNLRLRVGLAKRPAPLAWVDQHRVRSIVGIVSN